MMNLSDIRERRKKLGLTQKEFAALLGVSQSLIAKIESGKFDPKFSLVKKIFKVLDEIERRSARSIMHPSVITAEVSDPIRKVAKIMIEKGISQMPVLDKGKIVGSVTERGIFKAFFNGKADLKISEIIEAPLPVVSPDENISEVLKLLLDNPAVIVVDKDKIVGIITKHDVMKLGVR